MAARKLRLFAYCVLEFACSVALKEAVILAATPAAGSTLCSPVQQKRGHTSAFFCLKKPKQLWLAGVNSRPFWLVLLPAHYAPPL